MTHNVSLCVLVLFVMFAVSFGVQYVDATDNHVKMLNDYRKKDGIAKLFGVSGYITSNFANMTVTYPDDSMVQSSVSITDRGYFQTFVMLDDVDPAGLYRIVIHPYNDTAIVSSDTMSTSFFLSDYDGMLDVHITRNSVIQCMDSTPYCVEPGTSHIPKSFGVRFFNDDYNNHQIKLDSETSDVILPGGDAILFPKKTGTFEYYCVIHPWVNGKLHVSDVPSIKYVDTSAVNLITIPSYSDDMKNKNILNDTLQYDTNDCGTCYVGVVTKVIDGDTIKIDRKSVRLTLVDTPEKRQDGYNDATNLVLEYCPVGSSVLVDVDDIIISDGRGVNFAKITCGDTNINELLLNHNLAKMYNSSCTESEFMYEGWTRHNCKMQESFSEIIQKDIPVIPSYITNNTIPPNVTINTIKNISNNDTGIFYIVVAFIVILLCLVLLYRIRKNNSSQNVSFTDFEFLE